MIPLHNLRTVILPVWIRQQFNFRMKGQIDHVLFPVHNIRIAIWYQAQLTL